MNIQTQQLDHGYLPACRRLDLPSKRQCDRSFPAYSFVNPRIALPANASLEFHDGQMDGAKPGPNIHTPQFIPLEKYVKGRAGKTELLESSTLIGMEPEVDYETLAVMLEAWKQRGESLSALARAVGIKPQTLANAKQGQAGSISVETAQLLAEAMGLPGNSFVKNAYQNMRITTNVDVMVTIATLIESLATKASIQLTPRRRGELMANLYDLAMNLPKQGKSQDEENHVKEYLALLLKGEPSWPSKTLKPPQG